MRPTMIRKFSTAAKLVRTEVKQYNGVGVGTIFLSDPTRMNALTVEMGVQFQEAVDQMTKAGKAQEIRACIITGDGEAFSAGGDLAWLRERHSTPAFLNSLIMNDFYRSYLCVRNISVPTIAAINGAAIGAGMCMTLGCDIRVAATSAKLGFTFPKLGIHPGMGASVLLPRLVRPELALHLLISGEIISGENAKQQGLVLDAVAKDLVVTKAIELAIEYGKNSPIAVQGCMQTIRNQKFDGLDLGLAREADSQAHAYASEDFIRGLDAVKAKKSAQFLGWGK